jgi:hypothetical protein
MSVFLRWGIFGILGVAGLMYAYNASKQLAAKRAAQPVPVAAQAATQAEATTQAAPTSEESVESPEVSPRCEEELLVAQRAREARARGEPLDRLLRIQEIAFKEPPRRARLEKVATFWFKLSSEPSPEDLRDSAIRNCQNFN